MREDIYLDSFTWFSMSPTHLFDEIFNENENNFVMGKDGILFFDIEENYINKILRLLYKYRDKGRWI